MVVTEAQPTPCPQARQARERTGCCASTRGALR